MVHPWPLHHDLGGQPPTLRLSPCPNPYAPPKACSDTGHGGQFMARLSAPWQCRLLLGPGGSAKYGLSPDTGPIEVYRWCHPTLEVNGNKR